MRIRTDLGLSLLLAAALLPSLAAAEDETIQRLPGIEGDVRIEQRLDAQVPTDLVFRDENSQEVRLGDFLGQKPVILVLAYYRCPKLCTLVLNGLCDALQKVDNLSVGKEFEVVVVSFDPRDLPERAANKKKNYVAAYDRPGSENGWHFLTGDEEPIRKLTNACGYYYVYDPKSDQFAHPSAIMILTPQGRISKYFYGVQFVPVDVRLGLVEASEERIGTRVDDVLLYCFHYDPNKGKYTANVMAFLRMLGVLTLAVLGAFGAVLWRRDRRRQQEAEEEIAREEADSQDAHRDSSPPGE